MTPSEAQGEHRIRVLIVDDDRMFAEALEEPLGAFPDLEIVGSAHSAAEGLARVAHERPHVVLMDFGLPDMDGARATAELREAHPEIRVLMLTALVDEGVLLAALEAGVVGYVIKRQTVAELVDAIRAAYAGEALIAPAMLARLLPRLRPSGAPPPSRLTERELDVLRLVAEGISSPDIAATLFVSIHTVRKHIQNAMTKLGAHSKLEAVVLASRAGLLRYP
jgi:DNA-binding NarL/FixJ family response regulator